MNCQTLRLTYDPTGTPEAAVHEHLLECGSCQAYVNEINRLQSLLRTEPLLSVPRDFDARLRQRMEQVRKNPLYWWRFLNLRYALPGAAMVLVALTAAVLLDQPKESHPALSLKPSPSVASIHPVRSPDLQDAAVALAPVDTLRKAPSDPAPDVSWPPASTASARISRDPYPRIALEPLASPHPPIILRVRDESTHEEQLVTIPSVVFGGESVLASTATPAQNDDNVY